MSKKTVMTFISVLSIFFFCRTGSAQSQVRPAPAETCLILIDESASCDPARSADALKKLREAAASLAQLATEVKIGIFSNEGAFTRIETNVSVPAQSPLTDCSERAVNLQNVRLDPTTMFPGIRQYQENKKLKECRIRNKFLEQKNADLLESAIARIRSSIPEKLSPRPGCTAIVGLLQYMISRSRSEMIIIVITDGEETCSQGPLPEIKIPVGSKLLVFLLPKKGPITVEGPEALKRGLALQAAMPGALVQPYTNLVEVVSSLLATPDDIMAARMP